MRMKKIIAGLLVLALTAAVSIGATLAYLTDTDEDVNVMTLGKVKIDQLEYERVDVETKDKDATVQEFHDNKPLLPAVTKDGLDYAKPGDTFVDWAQIGKDGHTSPIWNPDLINNEVDKMVFVKNKGDYDAYVRSVFAFEAGKYATLDEFQKMVHLNLNTTDYIWEWVETPVAIPNEDGSATSNYFVATATYNKVLAPGALTEISLSQIALDKTATNEDVEAFGETYQVLVKSQGIQADGFEDADSALNEGFGKITSANIPWDNDAPTKGIDLFTALHYLEGDATGTKITANVTNVIFGKTAAHAAIADTYTGTLVDVEQDVPVYAYYVPNGGNYDIYVLANDVIYAPTISTSLFEEMGALLTVDTDNLDVSRVTSMFKMFRNCKLLNTLDVSDWDVSNVTDTRNMFRNCEKLTTLDVSDWDVGNVTDMNSMFCYCSALTALDVSNWDVSNVTNMTQLFMNCHALEALDVSQWDVGKVWRFKAMFATTAQNTGKMLFTELAVENWDMSSATDLEAMFYGCGHLTKLDLSKWDVSKVTKMPHIFTDCHSLTTINMSGWNTESLTCMDAMFNDCDSITVIDVSSFKTDKVKEFSQLFEACASLQRVIGLEKFNTANGQDFSEMFNVCYELRELDLSTFDTRNSNKDYITYYPWSNDMFNAFLSGCNKLEKITFGPHFSFDGDGTAPSNLRFYMPAATGVEGWDGYWYNAATGERFLPSEIPEETAATYVAVNPNPAP